MRFWWRPSGPPRLGCVNPKCPRNDELTATAIEFSHILLRAQKEDMDDIVEAFNKAHGNAQVLA